MEVEVGVDVIHQEVVVVEGTIHQEEVEEEGDVQEVTVLEEEVEDTIRLGLGEDVPAVTVEEVEVEVEDTILQEVGVDVLEATVEEVGVEDTILQEVGVDVLAATVEEVEVGDTILQVEVVEVEDMEVVAKEAAEVAARPAAAVKAEAPSLLLKVLRLLLPNRAHGDLELNLDHDLEISQYHPCIHVSSFPPGNSSNKDVLIAIETGHTSGRIVVKGKHSSQRLVLPYTATVLAGGLSYNPEVTRFRTDSPPPPRIFRLTNNFKQPVAITNVSLPLEARAYFEVTEFVQGILSPGQTVDLFQIAPILSPQLTLDTVIIVLTNVSQLSVPLLCYNGKLTKVIPPRNESQLELGTVGSGTEKQVVFALVNENPVAVTIKSWESSLANFAVSIAAIRDSNVSSFLSQPHHSLYNLTTQERTVGPGQYAVVSVKVHAGTQLGDTLAHLVLQTDFERVEIPAHMRVEHGSLQVTPDPVLFDDCFPGKVCVETLRVQSLFSVAMAVTSVTGGDTPLSFIPSSPSLLLPASTSTLGTLSYDTRQHPPHDNYLNITHNITGRWQDTVELAAHWADYDLGLLVARYDHFLNLSSRLVNLTLRIDTTEVREHEFGARVRLGWPRLSKHLSLPLTQVGHSTQQPLSISNPSTHESLLVQLVLENSYPSSVVQQLPPGLRPEPLAEAQASPTEFTIDTRNSEYKWAGTHGHRDSWLFLLPPTGNMSIVVNFTPTNAQLSTTHLLLRNNLTVLEAVRLSGSGAFTQFKFGNRKPGSSTPLLFELAEKHLKDCERERQRKLPAPNLTVKRSFTARNTGVLPISVRGFDISGIACEGYGFRVLNCEAFDLPPNTTRKVDIAFTPDLTLARVQRTLGVWTSDSDTVANYTLVATLPPFLLSSCSAVLARPTWEPLLYYCAITFMIFLLVCVLAAAFLESDRALKCALLAMSRDNATVQPVLDLKSIGTGVGLGQTDTLQTLAFSPTTPPSPTILQEPPVQEFKEKERERESVGVATVGVAAGLAGGLTAVKFTKKKEREKTSVNKRLSDTTDVAEHQTTWSNVFSKPVTVTLPKPQPKPVISTTVEASKLPNTDFKRKLSKKNLNPGRSAREVPTLPLPMSNNHNEDTETSSTTTESSHDDNDKEMETLTIVGSKTQRQRNTPASEGKKSVGGVEGNNGSASSLEQEWEDDKVQSNNRSRKSGKSSESGQISGSSSRNKSSNSSTKQSKDHSRTKEKQPLSLKRSIEKLPSLPKPVVLDPPPPVSMWDESRASFSDVVARSDSSKQNTHTVAPLQTPPTPLGPIGSKKTYTSVWDWDSELSLPTPQPPPPPPPPQPSSFFMHSRPPSVLQNASWEPNLLLKMLQAEEQRRLEAESRPRPTYQVTDTWSPWEPMTEPTPCAPQPPHPAPWGSDVWAPPPPDTWAPPGLAPRPPPRLDDTSANPQIVVGLDYDPFRSLSNIWSPHSTNIWKPPTTTNN